MAARKTPDHVPEKGFFFDDVDDAHTYYFDRTRMTGVTTALGVLDKPGLKQWSANLAAAYAYVAAHNMDPLRLAELTADIQRVAIKHGKINGDAARELDILYPEFKAARLKHNEKKETAGKHGTDIHAIVERYVNQCIEQSEGRPFTTLAAPDEDHEWKAIEQLMDWATTHVERFLYAERPMYDPELFIAGTADFGYVGTDGLRYIGDFKTSGGIYGVDYYLQVSAYRHLAGCMGDEPYDGATIVRIGKDDGSFEAHSVYEYETLRDVFLGCVRIYRAQQGIDGLTVKAY